MTAAETFGARAARTEVEVAAEVLAVLLRRGIIPLGMREEATRAVGLQTSEVTEAMRRRLPYDPPRRISVPAHPQPSPVLPAPRLASSPAPVPPRPAPSPPARRTPGRKRRTLPDGRLWCAGCEQFLDPEQFALRTDRPGRRKSRCRPCCSADQARRYLSVRKIEALDAARIQFVVDEDSELVGMACADCGRSIVADDLVRVEGRPRHSTCPEPTGG